MRFLCLQHTNFGLMGAVVECEESQRTQQLEKRGIIQRIVEEVKPQEYEKKVSNKRSKKHAVDSGN